MSMIEKVARALWDLDYPFFPWDAPERTDEEKDEYRQTARTAIEAMREPTPEMIDAGRFRYTLADETVEKSWGYMIQAALDGEG